LAVVTEAGMMVGREAGALGMEEAWPAAEEMDSVAVGRGGAAMD